MLTCYTHTHTRIHTYIHTYIRTHARSHTCRGPKVSSWLLKPVLGKVSQILEPFCLLLRRYTSKHGSTRSATSHSESVQDISETSTAH